MAEYTSIEEYTCMALEDTKFDISEIQSYIMKLGYLKIKWSGFLYKEEVLSAKFQQVVQAEYQKKLKYYTYDIDELIDKKDRDIYIKGDKEYQSLDIKYNAQKSKEQFVKEVLKTLDSQSFTINNLVKHIIWQSGV